VSNGRVAYTPEQLAEFKASFAKRRTRHIASFAAAFGSMVLMIVLPEPLSFPFGRGGPPLPFLIVPAFIVFSWINWRCPACNRSLGGEISPKYCSGCGTELQ
jgi:hypothetical protein